MKFPTIKPSGAIAAVVAMLLTGCGTPAMESIAKTISEAMPQAPANSNSGEAHSNAAPTAAPAPTASAKPEPDEKIFILSDFKIKVGGAKPTDPRWSGQRPSDTELKGLFTDKPMKSVTDNWPRVSITLTDYSETLVTLDPSLYASLGGVVGRVRPDECIKFDAVLWTNARTSRKFKNLVLCNSDISTTDTVVYPSNGMRSYSTLAFPPPSISSGQLRTEGPKIPRNLVPLELPNDKRIWRSGEYLFATLFHTMRYRAPLNDITDTRVWITKLSNDKF